LQMCGSAVARAIPFDGSALSEAIAAAIDAAPPGPSCSVLSVRWNRTVAAIAAAAARRAGVVPHIAATLARSLDAARHRHVAVFVATRSQAHHLVPLLKTLARASPRATVVFLTRAAVNRGPVLPAVPDVSNDDGKLEELVNGGYLEQADAWAGALTAEAVLLGRARRRRTVRAMADLRLRQGRSEEAAALASMVRLGVGMTCRPGGIAMKYLLPAVPDLLERIADLSGQEALTAAAEWVRRSAAARGAAFISAGTARFLAAAGPRPTPSVCRAALDRSATVTEFAGHGVDVTTPIRVGPAQVGAVIVSGPADRAETLGEAASIVAIVCAPLVKVRVDEIAAANQGDARVPELVGSSPSIRAVRSEIVRLAPAPFAVLIDGESGTGKELVARALHRLSPRRDRRFVAVNCAALSDELVEAELFGHSRGAFTGAVAPRTGLVEDAHGGTLFLDEVGELSLRAQAKLLRVLQEHELRRVGENHSRSIDVRVVAATNRQLTDAVAEGVFREDLLFRLAVVRIRLVPLRERTEDLAPLCQTFWRQTMVELDKRATLGADALARLAAHDWPGNVRELQNAMAGLGVAAPVRGRVGARLVDHVLAVAGASTRYAPMSLARARQLCDRQTVTAALARHAGRRSAAARELGVSRQGLGKLMRRLHLSDGAVEGVA
jgi:DNA-binding NtrC family response regulator